MLTFVLTASLGVLEAPITHVTVFTDQARVVRTAELTIDGSQTAEFPSLRADVDRSSIRVEAIGAEVRYVEVTPQTRSCREARLSSQSAQTPLARQRCRSSRLESRSP